MPGHEQEHAHDIVEFTQDLLMQIQVGKERTLISDALSFFLGSLMPTYTRAQVLAGMLADRHQAFLPTLAHHKKARPEGRAKSHLELQVEETRQCLNG